MSLKPPSKMKFKEILPETSLNLDIKGLTQSSRDVKEGYAFFALASKSGTDGHDFVKDAINKGAAVLILQNSARQNIQFSKEVLDRAVFVDDTRKAFSLACQNWFQNPAQALSIIGITGTNGKTTSTYLLENLLTRLGTPTAVIGTIQNRFQTQVIPSTLTTPDPYSFHSMLNTFLKSGAKAVACEVSSHALDQDRLWGVPFRAVLFTNLTQDHLDYHHTMEEYFNAKKKLFLEYSAKVRVVQIDDAFGKRLADECQKAGHQVITVGPKSATICTAGLKADLSGIRGKINVLNDEYPVNCPLTGQFNIANIGGAVGVLFGLGYAPQDIVQALQNLESVPGRMEKVENTARLQVFVDYAHTPDALKNALQTLRSCLPANAKLYCVFGCGGDRDVAKRPLMGAIATENADQIMLTSDNPRTENPEKILDEIAAGISKENFQKTQREVSRENAIRLALTQMSVQDALLIAGKGHETYQIIGSQSLPFDDCEVVKRVCGSLVK